MLASNARNSDEGTNLTFPKIKRRFLDFTTDKYREGLANDMKVSSKISKNFSKDSLARSIGLPSNFRENASDKCDARSIEGSERDDTMDDNCEGSDGGDGNLKDKKNVANSGHFRGVLIKCQDEETLSSQGSTSTRNGLRRTAFTTDVAPQLTVVDYGPKTSRVGSDYQVGVVRCCVLQCSVV